MQERCNLIIWENYLPEKEDSQRCTARREPENPHRGVNKRQQKTLQQKKKHSTEGGPHADTWTTKVSYYNFSFVCFLKYFIYFFRRKKKKRNGGIKERVRRGSSFTD
ncbi:hypothetical protein AGOR_G00104620 [Albula goreensis]|uniref:Uncharacterized protein n=1 Tax=Albula goreensis TaxID=1534307 RepID=A0A8T3DLY5_9TELE|nr:hypothetical protein AGOR_G00104620 [Albula goreensis]